MATYSANRLIPVGVVAQLQTDNGGLPDLSRTIGSTGRGIGVRLSLPAGAGGGDFAQVWAQPCIVSSQPLGGPGTEEYLPIGGAGQLIIPGPMYCWTREALGMASLAVNANAVNQIDLGIALWRRRGRLTVDVRVFRLD